MEDQFEKINKAKKERVAKNELQRLRNIARNMKGKGLDLNYHIKLHICRLVGIIHSRDYWLESIMLFVERKYRFFTNESASI